jgi:polyhydroxybutyrate depolymerase
MFFLLLLLALPPAHAKGAGMQSYDTKANGLARSYVVYTPDNLPKKPVPLLVLLHGGFGNADAFSESTGFNEIAEKEKFVIVYPQGVGIRLAPRHRVWNAGKCCGIAREENVDDVAFVNLVVREAMKKVSLDPKRIYLAGMSNGGMMAYRLLCESPDLFAAVAVVSGSLVVDQCTKGRKVPLLHVHGSADTHVPFSGGSGIRSGGIVYRSVPETLALVTKTRDCGKPLSRNFKNGDTETTYRCQQGAPVVLHVIKGGAHAWPHGPVVDSARIWGFLRRFSK